jgi:hypothetical protein
MCAIKTQTLASASSTSAKSEPAKKKSSVDQQKLLSKKNSSEASALTPSTEYRSPYDKTHKKLVSLVDRAETDYKKDSNQRVAQAMEVERKDAALKPDVPERWKYQVLTTAKSVSAQMDEGQGQALAAIAATTVKGGSGLIKEGLKAVGVNLAGTPAQKESYRRGVTDKARNTLETAQRLVSDPVKTGSLIGSMASRTAQQWEKSKQADGDKGTGLTNEAKLATMAMMAATFTPKKFHGLGGAFPRNVSPSDSGGSVSVGPTIDMVFDQASKVYRPSFPLKALPGGSEPKLVPFQKQPKQLGFKALGPNVTDAALRYNRLAEKVTQRAHYMKDWVQDHLQRAATSLPVNLDLSHLTKTAESTAKKMQRDRFDGLRTVDSPIDVKSNNFKGPGADALRTTGIGSGETLIKAAEQFQRNMESLNWETVQVKNNFRKGERFIGAKMMFKHNDPIQRIGTPLNVEVQWQTKEGHAAQQDPNSMGRKLYQQIQQLQEKGKKGSPEYVALEKKMAEHIARIPLPDGAERLINFPRRALGPAQSVEP